MAEEVKVRLDWSAGDSVPVQPANIVLVQNLGDEFILSFGHAPPPASMAMSDEPAAVYLEKHAVPVQQIVRFTLPVEATQRLLQTLQAHVPNAADAE